jgi:hypothetical protein
MSDALQRMGHDLVVLGGPDDQARGEMLRAELAMRVDRSAVSESDTVEGRRWAIQGLVDDARAHFGEALVISDEPRDRAAADSLNITTVSPFDFGFEWVGEEA